MLNFATFRDSTMVNPCQTGIGHIWVSVPNSHDTLNTGSLVIFKLLGSFSGLIDYVMTGIEIFVSRV